MKETSLGAELRKLRKANRRTLDDVSRAVGISLSYLGDLETDEGRCPNPALLMKLLNALGARIEFERLYALGSRGRGAIEIPLAPDAPAVAELLACLAARLADGRLSAGRVVELTRVLRKPDRVKAAEPPPAEALNT